MEFKNVPLDNLSLLFNSILDRGFFPASWCEATCILIPLHKKGDYSDPNNHRGISLISCFAKLFTTILNKRLLKWGAVNDVLTDAQF
jgi:hypothetical protein